MVIFFPYIVYYCNLLNLGVIYYLGVIYPSQYCNEIFRRIFFFLSCISCAVYLGMYSIDEIQNFISPSSIAYNF